MQLFLVVFVPGMLVCWLYFRNRNSWGHAIVGVILGAVTSYGVIYILGNFVQADSIAAAQRQLGEQLATDIANAIYGNALKSAVGAIAGCAIAMKLRKKAARSAS